MLSRRSFLKDFGMGTVFCLLPFSAVADAHYHSRKLFSAEQTEIHMGTLVTIKTVSDSKEKNYMALDAAFREMHRLEGLLSRHDAESPLVHLNAHKYLDDAPRELLSVLKHAKTINRITRGAFDPTILPLLEHYEQSGQTAFQDESTCRKLLASVGLHALRIDGDRVELANEGAKITLDGIAKGFIVDSAARKISELGIDDFLINAGGDITARGHNDDEPWRIAVRDPNGVNNDPLCVFELTDASVATSGSYVNRFDKEERHHHIIDPHSGTSPSYRSITVKASSCMLADALATSLGCMENPLSFAGNEKGVSCLLLDRNGRIYRTVRPI